MEHSLFNSSKSPSVCNISHNHFIVVTSLEVSKAHSHLYPRMPCPHPKKLRTQLLNAVAENNWHLGLHQHRHHSIMLVPCHFVGFFFLYQSKVKVLFASFILRVEVVIIFDFLVQLLGVNFGNILYHDSHIFRIELPLKMNAYYVLSIFNCMRCYRRWWFYTNS